MGTGPSATETKRNVLRVLLVEGAQSVKLVVDPEKLEPISGFPDPVLSGYDDGIPLDLNPAWPLELDLNDRAALCVSLSFGGQVCRCRVAWSAITTIAVGLGGVCWEHEEHDPPPPAAPPPQTASGTHLRVVK